MRAVAEAVENRDRGDFLPVFAPRPIFHPASTARHFHGLRGNLMGFSAWSAFSDNLCAMGVLAAAAPACFGVAAQQPQPLELVAPQSLAKLPSCLDSEYQSVRPPTRRPLPL